MKELIENVGQILLPTGQQESRIVTLAAGKSLLISVLLVQQKLTLEFYSATSPQHNICDSAEIFS